MTLTKCIPCISIFHSITSMQHVWHRGELQQWTLTPAWCGAWLFLDIYCWHLIQGKRWTAGNADKGKQSQYALIHSFNRFSPSVKKKYSGFSFRFMSYLVIEVTFLDKKEGHLLFWLSYVAVTWYASLSTYTQTAVSSFKCITMVYIAFIVAVTNATMASVGRT